MTELRKEPLSPEELVKRIEDAFDDYAGNANTFEKSVGMYFVGRRIGWRPLLLMSDPRTVKKAEEILGIDFKATLPEEGPKANKSFAWKAVQKVSSYWRAVRGDFPGVRSTEVV